MLFCCAFPPLPYHLVRGFLLNSAWTRHWDDFQSGHPTPDVPDNDDEIRGQRSMVKSDQFFDADVTGTFWLESIMDI